MKKPYKSLQDIYSASVAANTRILFVKEDATVLIQKDQEKDVDEFKVTNQTADKLRKEIRNETYEGKIMDYLAQKNYSANAFQGKGFNILASTILESSDEELKTFSDFIDKAEKPKLSEATQGNIMSVAKSQGIADSIITNLSSLNELTDRGGSKIGPGEIAVALLFDDVKNSLTGGDLLMGSSKVEVKKGGGRLGQQPGRGGMALSPTIFIEPFVKNKDALSSYVQQNSGNDIVKHLIASYKLIAPELKNEAAGYIHKILDSIYAAGKNVASKYVTKEALDKGNYEALKADLLKLNIEGYMKSDYFLFIDNNYNYILADKNSMLMQDGLVDTRKIWLRSNYRFNDLYPGVVLR